MQERYELTSNRLDEVELAFMEFIADREEFWLRFDDFERSYSSRLNATVHSTMKLNNTALHYQRLILTLVEEEGKINFDLQRIAEKVKLPVLFTCKVYVHGAVPIDGQVSIL